MKSYKINLDKVWNHYPNPKTANDEADCKNRDYCVGGAVCQYARKYLHIGDDQDLKFPSSYRLAFTLLKLNPNLNGNAYYYAKNIVMYNDVRQFEKAKQYVAEALEYKNGKV